jgi:short-subunit dehydrogenase
MARIFITGSSDGLGHMAARLLVEQGHSVVLHARSQQRADETQNKLPAAESVVVGDLTSITQTRHIADQVNQLGAFDAVIHNAGIGYQEPKRIVTERWAIACSRCQYDCAVHPYGADYST